MLYHSTSAVAILVHTRSNYIISYHIIFVASVISYRIMIYYDIAWDQQTLYCLTSSATHACGRGAPPPLRLCAGLGCAKLGRGTRTIIKKHTINKTLCIDITIIKIAITMIMLRILYHLVFLGGFGLWGSGASRRRFQSFLFIFRLLPAGPAGPVCCPDSNIV